MIQEPTPRHSVSVAAAIVNDAGEVLVIRRRDNGNWEPPGGVLELDETIEDGLRREVHEEIGLEIEIDRLTGVYKNMTRGIVALVFRCVAVGGSVQLSDETSAVEWVRPDEAQELMLSAYVYRLLDAIVDSDRPAIRAHDGKDVLL